MIFGLQFVFAITEPTEPIVGGHVWRSDNYGREGSWKDVTMQMDGASSDQSGRAMAKHWPTCQFYVLWVQGSREGIPSM